MGFEPRLPQRLDPFQGRVEILQLAVETVVSMKPSSKTADPIAVNIPGWSIGDRFACSRGRKWRVVGFGRSTSGPLLRGVCTDGSPESDCPSGEVNFAPEAVTRLEETI